jgi:hypothetical protein
LNKKIVKFNGGLGNQMFQYAFSLMLAEKFNAEILFDFSYFEDVKSANQVTTREFELNVFNLCCKGASLQDLAQIKRPEFKSKFKNTLAKKFSKRFGINYIREKNNSVFDKNLFEYPEYYYYEGYFQNEKYFKHLRKILLDRFSLQMPLDEKNQYILDKIRDTNSVSIHIRRGDYVSLDYVNKSQGTCSLGYYNKAIEHVVGLVEKPHFFLFSDDINWVIENLKIKYPFTIVDFNPGKGYFDMNLMKQCKHNIIANSSFSWWGAWLNQYPEKIVVAPKNWTAKKQKCDLVPSDWTKL